MLNREWCRAVELKVRHIWVRIGDETCMDSRSCSCVVLLVWGTVSAHIYFCECVCNCAIVFMLESVGEALGEGVLKNILYCAITPLSFSKYPSWLAVEVGRANQCIFTRLRPQPHYWWSNKYKESVTQPMTVGKKTGKARMWHRNTTAALCSNFCFAAQQSLTFNPVFA